MNQLHYGIILGGAVVAILAIVIGLQVEPEANVELPGPTISEIEQSNLKAVQEAISEQRLIEEAYEREYGTTSSSNGMAEYWERATPTEGLP